MSQLTELIKMFIDAIKLLLEEPGKILQAFLSLSKLLLTLVFTEWIYRKAFGNYQVIDFTSLLQWKEYLLSGRIFMCMIFFALTYLFLFYVLPGLSSLPFQLINYLIKKPIKIGKTEGALIFRFLRMFKLLDYDEEKQRILTMEKTDELLEFIKAIVHKEARSEVSRYKDTLISDLGHTYFVFIIFYFTILPGLQANRFVSEMVIAVFILILFFYMSASLAFEIVQTIAHDLIVITKMAIYDNIIERNLRMAGLKVGYPADKTKPQIVSIYHNSQVYDLKYFPEQIPVDIKLVKQCIEMAKEGLKKMIVFTDQEVYPQAIEAAVLNSQHIQIITFTGREELTEKVRELLRNHVMK
ncbi:MAG: hypothetical protein V4557_12355 [Bacteroidota bacterium]